ncbi:MAG: alpha/beta hydrolase [Kineosporiaceae bacterium]
MTTRDALRLAADIYLPSDPPLAAAVIAHGFTGSRRERGVREQALALRARGFAVVVPDGRGHGESPGACTMGCDEVLDVAAAVEHARLLSDDVVVVGASMGAISVLRYAADDPELAGVVAVSGPATWTLPRTPIGMLNAALTQTRPGRTLLKRRMGVSVAPGFTYAEPPVELVGHIASPLAIVHGSRDRIIPARAAHDLYAAASGPRVLHLVPGMGHAFEEVGRATVTAAAEWTLGYQEEPDAAA